MYIYIYLFFFYRIEGGVTWEEAVTIINGYKEHLDTLISPFILSLADSEVTKVQEYLEMYDLSKGSSEEVSISSTVKPV